MQFVAFQQIIGLFLFANACSYAIYPALIGWVYPPHTQWSESSFGGSLALHRMKYTTLLFPGVSPPTLFAWRKRQTADPKRVDRPIYEGSGRHCRRKMTQQEQTGRNDRKQHQM